MDMLDPCPFCGGDAEIARNTTAHFGWYARCHSCKSDGGQFLVKTKVLKTKDQAVEAWNTRSCPPLAALSKNEDERTDNVDQVAREAVGTLMHLCACLGGIDKVIDVSEVDRMYDVLLSLGIEVDV